MHLKLFPKKLVHAENVGGEIDKVSNQRAWIGAIPCGASRLTGEISPGRRGAAHPHCDSRTSGLDPSQRLDFPASYTAVRQLKARQNYSGTRLRISPPKSPPAASRRSEPPIRSSRQKPLTPPTHQGFFVVRALRDNHGETATPDSLAASAVNPRSHPGSGRVWFSQAIQSLLA